jgi:hypothetical protein
MPSSAARTRSDTLAMAIEPARSVPATVKEGSRSCASPVRRVSAGPSSSYVVRRAASAVRRQRAQPATKRWLPLPMSAMVLRLP